MLIIKNVVSFFPLMQHVVSQLNMSSSAADVCVLTIPYSCAVKPAHALILKPVKMLISLSPKEIFYSLYIWLFRICAVCQIKCRNIFSSVRRLVVTSLPQSLDQEPICCKVLKYSSLLYLNRFFPASYSAFGEAGWETRPVQPGVQVYRCTAN